MDLLFGLIQAILGIGFSIVSIIFKVILAGIAALIAVTKRRNPIVWGLATLIFPWVILIVLFMPRRYPKFSSHLKTNDAFKDKNPVIASIMALAAIVAKSDGNISKEDISLVKQFVSRQFGIVGEELNSYAGAFDYGKNHPEEYKEFTSIITGYYNRRDIILGIAYLLVAIAVQEDGISENEDLQIRKILSELGLSQYEYESIKNSFTQGYNQYNGQAGNNFMQDKSVLIKKHSAALGVDENASMAEIKKAYRKLVKEYHPDKMASESMPKEYMDFANQKIREINEAYEYLKSVKEA